MKRKDVVILCATMFIVILAYTSYAYNFPKIFPFNEENALQEWQEKIFKDKVMYVVKPKLEEGLLSATSDQACSGLLYKVKFNVRKLPMFSWKWKVVKFPAKDVETRKEEGWIERDDYAARVYVIFSSWNFMNIKSLEYIWDETLEEGTVMTSPYFKNIRLIVAESGKENINNWVFEERNIYKDFEEAFGHRPPKYATAIALMTDADNTLSTAEALYKDIKVGYKNE